MMRIQVIPQGPPLEEPITPAQLEAIARIVPGDEEAALWPGYISAARQQVEHDTERILIATDCLVIVAYDLEPWTSPTAGQGWVELALSGPILFVKTATAFMANTARAVEATRYQRWGTRLRVRPEPLGTDRVEYEVTLGWPSAAALAELAPSLVLAVGLLAAHYVTSGRDLAVVGTTAAAMPMGYADAIQAYRVESLA